MLVSIMINNYNYARYLPEAIDSALAQTYPHTEVVVVDDGSTDDSRRVIAGYGGRVIPVFKENGGQASAFNAGFEACRGRLICFLDADDMFVPEKVARVVQGYKRNQDATLIYHRLQRFDSGRGLIGTPFPKAVLRGDVKDAVERSGGWWPRPTTSALCCPRPYLERILPMPESEFRLCADAYVAGLAPFVGPLLGLKLPLTCYREHGDNYFTSKLTKDRSGARVRAQQSLHEFQLLKRALHEMLGERDGLVLTRNYPYQRYAWAAGGSTPLHRVILTTLRSPVMPPSVRIREVAKLLLGK